MPAFESISPLKVLPSNQLRDLSTFSSRMV